MRRAHCRAVRVPRIRPCQLSSGPDNPTILETPLTQVLETDIAVVGAGTAGLTAFHEIRRAGRAAVLIDHGPLGTTCARVGCMPSKAVLHAGHDAALARKL